jgi:hypothetical protein
MFSRALLTKLNCLDFLLLKGQSHDKVLKKFMATFCKSEKPVLR